ncbi:MAG TPA: hypothetical protein DCY27_11025 [Desulfobacterales bacterium]|nr:hypothetical protein [Desulfobacterales bacterium]
MVFLYHRDGVNEAAAHYPGILFLLRLNGFARAIGLSRHTIAADACLGNAKRLKQPYGTVRL